MNKPIHPLALFRLSVLGPLASRNQFKHGEVKAIIRELAAKTYNIPGSRRVHLSSDTILRWYYVWKRGGIAALAPQSRQDKGSTQLSPEVQAALIEIKKDNKARSLNTLINMLESLGVVTHGQLARATVHRFLRHQNLSQRVLADTQTIERRSFVALHAGDIWHGDVLHGPSIQTPTGMRKTYLVSLLDDASRLITHSAFCLGETALDIEGVLKQALLKRGVPYKLIIDNGAAYRSHTLQAICASLEIRLIYCRPYEPEGKGKLERFHRTFRGQFLNEIQVNTLSGLDELNARLWAWLEQVYHLRAHHGLDGKSPLERWRDDLIHVRPLGFKAENIDEIFYHRIERTVRKDATISWGGSLFEVPYQQARKKVVLVINPHTNTTVRIESDAGDILGLVTPLDRQTNLYRKRQRPEIMTTINPRKIDNAVELALREQSQRYSLSPSIHSTTHEEK